MENKSYYDWLEVSPKASPEVIEKAYKALVIKYHPDLQKQNKQSSEDIIKKLNEAYSVLSDSVKREEYDEKIKLEKQRQIQIANVNIPVQEPPQNSFSFSQEELNRQQAQLESDYYRQMDEVRRQAYHDAYIEDMRNRGYKIRYKKSFKYYIKLAVIVLIIFFVIWLIWQIPFVRDWINGLAESNFLIKLFVDIIKSIYEALFETFF